MYRIAVLLSFFFFYNQTIKYEFSDPGRFLVGYTSLCLGVFKYPIPKAIDMACLDDSSRYAVLLMHMWYSPDLSMPVVLKIKTS